MSGNLVTGENTMQRRPSAPAPFSRLAQILGAGLLTTTLLATAPARAAEQVEMSPEARPAPYSRSQFGSDPKYSIGSYDTKQQIDIYGGKKKVDEPRPLIELGQPMYTEGPLDPSFDVIGRKNLVQPSFLVYGDWRTGAAYNHQNNNKEIGQVATRLNLDVDLQFTATERLHALFRPLDFGGKFTHAEIFGPDANHRVTVPVNLNPRTLFFEGDIGNLVAGFTDRYQSYDLPFAVGLVPLIMQNGVWFNSAISGGAISIIGRNSPAAGIANMDLTFFAGFDRKTDRQVFGAATFIEANEGYWEAGIGGVHDDRLFGSGSYGNATVAFTKRYFGWLSNSLRAVGTFGDTKPAVLPGQPLNGNGFIFLMENSLISAKELVLVPYFNLWAGFGRPQSLLRNGDAGGILFNTGILFQTDGLTNYPTMDALGQNTYGGALGVNYLFNLEQQIVLEAATVQRMNNNFVIGPKGDQYGVGIRYQKNLTRYLIWRADAMYAVRENEPDILGIRTEIRQKF
jgi:hypothetical protein